jgi:hypothetical protein
MADRTNTLWLQKREPTLALLTASAGFISALSRRTLLVFSAFGMIITMTAKVRCSVAAI